MIAAAEVKEAQEGKKKGQTGRGKLKGGLWGGRDHLRWNGGDRQGFNGSARPVEGQSLYALRNHCIKIAPPVPQSWKPGRFPHF